MAKKPESTEEIEEYLLLAQDLMWQAIRRLIGELEDWETPAIEPDDGEQEKEK